MAIREENKIIQSRVHGNCVVIHGYMYPLTDFLRGPLCKPTLEVQQRAAFVRMHDQHDVDTFHQVINSFEYDLHMRDLRTMVFLPIARVTSESPTKAARGGRKCGCYKSMIDAKSPYMVLGTSGYKCSDPWHRQRSVNGPLSWTRKRKKNMRANMRRSLSKSLPTLPAGIAGS